MRDWAHYRDIPFLFNSNFPVRSVTPLRVALVDEKAIDAIFTAAWAENLDVGDKAVLQNVLDEHGFLGEQLLVKTEEHAIKEQLKAVSMLCSRPHSQEKTKRQI
jgi:2-hydroxychromene-2-carboxylate isomerase